MGTSVAGTGRGALSALVVAVALSALPAAGGFRAPARAVPLCRTALHAKDGFRLEDWFAERRMDRLRRSGGGEEEEARAEEEVSETLDMYYTALSKRMEGAMAGLWGAGDVTLLLPGFPRVTGKAAVMDVYRRMMSEATRIEDVKPANKTVHLSGNYALVVTDEVVDSKEGQKRLQATSVLRRSAPSSWFYVFHHSSPVMAPAAAAGMENMARSASLEERLRVLGEDGDDGDGSRRAKTIADAIASAIQASALRALKDSGAAVAPSSKPVTRIKLPSPKDEAAQAGDERVDSVDDIDDDDDGGDDVAADGDAEEAEVEREEPEARRGAAADAAPTAAAPAPPAGAGARRVNIRGTTRRTAQALRTLGFQGKLENAAMERLLQDVISEAAGGGRSVVEVAYEAIVQNGRLVDWSNYVSGGAMSDFCEQCKIIDEAGGGDGPGAGDGGAPGAEGG